jgi:hypothetical protein
VESLFVIFLVFTSHLHYWIIIYNYFVDLQEIRLLSLLGCLFPCVMESFNYIVSFAPFTSVMYSAFDDESEQFVGVSLIFY